MPWPHTWQNKMPPFAIPSNYCSTHLSSTSQLQHALAALTSPKLPQKPAETGAQPTGTNCWCPAGNEGMTPMNHPLWLPLRGIPRVILSFLTEHQQEQGLTSGNLPNAPWVLRLLWFSGLRPAVRRRAACADAVGPLASSLGVQHFFN